MKKIKFPDHFIAILKSYTTCRSSSSNFCKGCPQGSYLGLTLWKLEYHYMFTEMSNEDTNTIHNADDKINSRYLCSIRYMNYLFFPFFLCETNKTFYNRNHSFAFPIKKKALLILLRHFTSLNRK